MRIVELNTNAFLASKEDKKFIILCSNEASQPKYVENVIIPKINGKRKPSPNVPGFWGTLGFSDNDSSIDWSGHLEISSEGNDSFTGVVNEEVELIKKCYPKLLEGSSKILERFISFEHLDFTLPEMFSLDTIPKLRLELMLESDDGAIVFYQSDKENNDESFIEYIQPQPTTGNEANERDRLRYNFDIIPQYQLVPIKNIPGYYQLNTTKEPKPFILKIITFKRLFDQSFDEQNKKIPVNSKDIILQVEDELNKVADKKTLLKNHKLLIFDRTINNFKEAELSDIDPTKKTLFLMHGTFSTTEGSFGDLYGKEGKWLKRISKKKRPNHYQIIAFDHPTLFFGAEENIEELFNCMDELNIDEFTEEVDFIGTSQGGLLVQFLANENQKRIPVGKAALVASANGVGYLTAAQHVSKFLSVLKYFFKITRIQPLAFISAIAQHSAEFILQQPGLQIMTPGHEKLNSILKAKPHNENTRYLPIIDDYDEFLLDAEHRRFIRFIKKMGARGVDKVAKTMLGKYNDWVVGTKNQFIVPADYCVIPNYNPAKFRNHIIYAIHGTCFRKTEAKKKLNAFLSNEMGKEQIVTSVDHFDAHCHVFGRGIITSRILHLLIQDLVSYIYPIRKKDEKIPLIPGLLDEMDDKAEDKKQPGSIAKNIIKYFALNKNSWQVLDDLEDEYYGLKSNVFRYMPLMFDLEMTFRNDYKKASVDNNIESTEVYYKDQINAYNADIDDLIDCLDKNKNQVFDGTKIEKEESIKNLKFIKTSIKALGVLSPELKNNTKTGFLKQIDEMEVLKTRYGNNMFPFLAVDPRRENMAKIIIDNVGKDKTFHGIKLYAPNGYSPTDRNLFDNDKKFIDGKSLYSYCIKNNIPIIAHCSNAGFATFVKDIEVYGDVIIKDKIVSHDEPTKIEFSHNLIDGGFDQAVRERAITLNHPKLWELVLKEYPDLKICLAHFGGESKDWREDIAELMRTYTNLYTDLSCIVREHRLKTIKSVYYDTSDPIKERIMFGSDFYFNMLNKITFSNYYKHFKDTFTKEEFKNMSLSIPEKFLGI